MSVYAPLDQKNHPKGIAFVSMSTEEELEAVLAGMVDAELGGRKIFVNKAKKKGEKSNKDPNCKCDGCIGSLFGICSDSS